MIVIIIVSERIFIRDDSNVTIHRGTPSLKEVPHSTPWTVTRSVTEVRNPRGPTDMGPPEVGGRWRSSLLGPLPCHVPSEVYRPSKGSSTARIVTMYHPGPPRPTRTPLPSFGHRERESSGRLPFISCEPLREPGTGHPLVSCDGEGRNRGSRLVLVLHPLTRSHDVG